MLHGMGCAAHFNARIGNDCRIFQHVTIGAKWSNGDRDTVAPVLENTVTVGASAVIFENVHIGVGSIIGANAVVLKDVPPGSVAVGIPAKCVQ